MECRRIEDPLEQRACNASYDFLAGICSHPGFAKILHDLAAEEISKEEADKRLQALWKEGRK